MPRPLPLVLTILLVAVTAQTLAAEALTSTTDMVFDAVENREGIHLAAVPAADISPTRYTEDYAPPQVLELRRADGQPLSVGRLITSCSCLSASMEKRDFGPDEQALITVRVVKQPPVAGARYAVIAQVLSPQAVMVQYDVEVQ